MSLPFPHLISASSIKDYTNQQPCKRRSSAKRTRLVWPAECLKEELGPTFKNGRFTFLNAKCSFLRKRETLRALGSHPHMATIALRQGQLPHVVEPADSCSSPPHHPSVFAPGSLGSFLLLALTLAGIQGSNPFWTGLAGGPSTAQWDGDPQPYHPTGLCSAYIPGSLLEAGVGLGKSGLRAAARRNGAGQDNTWY